LLDNADRNLVSFLFVSFMGNLEIRAMQTFVPSGKNLEQSRKWYLIDATGKTVGRLASQVARLLMGKNKPIYTPFLDVGDHVIIINAEKVVFTGRKWRDKVYRHHTGWPGGLKEITAQKLFEQHPERILESAIRGMLPKTKLGRAMAKKLRVYVGPDHPHKAQKPEPLDV
jgi:large subunit ribosomal protein L13